MKWHQKFFWLLLALLPTQLGLHFWPEWAGVLGRRVDYLAPTLFLTDLLVFLTTGCWLASVFFQGAQGNTKSQILSQRLISLWLTNPKQIPRFKIPKLQTKHVWLAAVLAFVGINIFIATNIPVAVYKWIKVCEYILLGLYIVRTKPKLSFVITPLAVGVLYSSILAITQFFLQHSVGGPLWWLGERTFGVDTPGIARYDFDFRLSTFDFRLFGLRPYATFPHPNVLGGFLAAVLPLLCMSLMRPMSLMSPMNQRIKYLHATALVLGAIALLLTFSRSAIVVGGAGIGISILYLVFRKKMNRVFAYILYTIPFILFLVLAVWSFSPKEESVVVRQQLNNAAIKLWTASPLFGVGLGNFLVRLPEALPSRTIYFLQPVHNIYLLVLAETGVVGFVFIVIFIWQSIKGLVFRIKENRKELLFNLNTIYFVPFFCILLLGLVDHYPLTLQQGQLLLTVLVGMSIVVLQSNKVTNRRIEVQ
ncbi:MAG: O-antigen ligase family protein [Candidatus Gottesmanbacteria bacterium]|nr:O-antigen ligase family protein [Candidatus Gottesmanbacteria bacterium]